MKSLKQYSVPFTGLKLGTHHFDFDVTDAFFDEFEYSLVKNGTLKVDLELDRQETMMVLDFTINGIVMLSCDRCLAEYPQQISSSDRLIGKFSEEKEMEDTTDEVVILSKKDTEIDVSAFIYEIITLALPYINVCESPGNTESCDKEMIAKLNEFSASAAEEDNEEIADSRWEALKNIKK